MEEKVVNQLLLGDCLQLLPNIPSKSIQMILVDLPYGTTRNAWDSIIPLEPLWKEYNRIITDNGVMVFTAAQPFDKVLAASNISNYRYEWIWHKNRATGHLNAKKMPLRAHENVLVFYKNQPTYNPQHTTGHAPMNAVYAKKLEKGETRNYNHAEQVENTDKRTTRLPRSVLNIRVHDNIRKDKIHPTQKPIELMAYMIKTYTNEGDTVLDNSMGSGTTCAAAKALGRHYIGMEIKKDYYDHAVERIENTNYGDLDDVELVAADFQQTRQITTSPKTSKTKTETEMVL